MDFGVDVNNDPICGESLGAVAGDSVTMIEVTHLMRVKIDAFATVHPHGKLAGAFDVLDRAKVTVGNAQLFRRCGET